VNARELSQQREAVRKRNYRERIRQRHVPNVPEVPLTSPPVPPAPTSSAAAAAPSTGGNAPVPPAPATTLLETQPVRGAGADAYAAPLNIGATDAADGVPLVDEPVVPKAEREPISPQKAALMGKIVAGYVKFGWSALVADHVDTLAAVLEPLMSAQPELAALAPDQKVAIGIELLVSQVRESSEALAVKYNIQIPYIDEGIVGVSVGTATLGVVKLFTKPKAKNDNERMREAKDANPPKAPETPPPARARAVPDADKGPTDEPPASAVRAAGRGPTPS
jgi:hypothetical protein